MSKGIIKRYTDAKSKKNVGVTAMKSGVELVSATAGGGIGAAAGIASPFIGIAMLLAGNYFGDKTGLLKTAGAGMIGYGIANAIVNRNNASSAAVNGLGAVSGNVKQRLIDYKDNLMHAFYLDKIFKGKNGESKSGDLGSVPYLDTSGLDAFMEFNDQMATRQAIDEADRAYEIIPSDELPVYEDVIEDEVDFTSF